MRNKDILPLINKFRSINNKLVSKIEFKKLLNEWIKLTHTVSDMRLNNLMQYTTDNRLKLALNKFTGNRKSRLHLGDTFENVRNYLVRNGVSLGKTYSNQSRNSDITIEELDRFHDLMSRPFKTGEAAKQFLVDLYSKFNIDFTIKDFRIFAGWRLSYIELNIDSDKFDLPDDFLYILRFHFDDFRYDQTNEIAFREVTPIMKQNVKNRKKYSKEELALIKSKAQSVLEEYFEPLMYPYYIVKYHNVKYIDKKNIGSLARAKEFYNTYNPGVFKPQQTESEQPTESERPIDSNLTTLEKEYLKQKAIYDNADIFENDFAQIERDFKIAEAAYNIELSKGKDKEVTQSDKIGKELADKIYKEFEKAGKDVAPTVVDDICDQITADYVKLRTEKEKKAIIQKNVKSYEDNLRASIEKKLRMELKGFSGLTVSRRSHLTIAELDRFHDLISRPLKNGEAAIQFLVDLYSNFDIDFTIEDFKIFTGYNTHSYIELKLNSLTMPDSHLFALRFYFDDMIYALSKEIAIGNVTVTMKQSVKNGNKHDIAEHYTIRSEAQSFLEEYFEPLIYPYYIVKYHNVELINNDENKKIIGLLARAMKFYHTAAFKPQQTESVQPNILDNEKLPSRQIRDIWKKIYEMGIAKRTHGAYVADDLYYFSFENVITKLYNNYDRKKLEKDKKSYEFLRDLITLVGKLTEWEMGRRVNGNVKDIYRYYIDNLTYDQNDRHRGNLKIFSSFLKQSFSAHIDPIGVFLEETKNLLFYWSDYHPEPEFIKTIRKEAILEAKMRILKNALENGEFEKEIKKKVDYIIKQPNTSKELQNETSIYGNNFIFPVFKELWHSGLINRPPNKNNFYYYFPKAKRKINEIEKIFNIDLLKLIYFILHWDTTVQLDSEKKIKFLDSAKKILSQDYPTLFKMQFGIEIPKEEILNAILDISKNSEVPKWVNLIKESESDVTFTVSKKGESVIGGKDKDNNIIAYSNNNNTEQPKEEISESSVNDSLRDPIYSIDDSCYAVYIPIENINTDPARFQNRTDAFSELSAKSVAENYDPNKFDPITVWLDPKDEKLYVLSGHSRLEGMKRRKEKRIPCKFFNGTEAEAIQFARVDANRGATQETLPEDLKAYRLMKEGDKKAGLEPRSTKEIAAAFKGKEPRKLAALVELNPNGKFIEYLSDENLAAEIKGLKRIAVVVGNIKKDLKNDNKEMSNSQEDSIFDFIATNRQAQRINDADLADLIIERFATKKDKLFACKDDECSDEIMSLEKFTESDRKAKLTRELIALEKDYKKINDKFNTNSDYDKIYTEEEKNVYRRFLNDIHIEISRIKEVLDIKDPQISLFGIKEKGKKNSEYSSEFMNNKFAKGANIIFSD